MDGRIVEIDKPGGREIQSGASYRLLTRLRTRSMTDAERYAAMRREGITPDEQTLRLEATKVIASFASAEEPGRAMNQFGSDFEKALKESPDKALSLLRRFGSEI